MLMTPPLGPCAIAFAAKNHEFPDESQVLYADDVLLGRAHVLVRPRINKPLRLYVLMGPYFGPCADADCLRGYASVIFVRITEALQS